MNNLFIIYETFTNGYILEILDILSIVAILCGILVIVSKNPIISILFLIGLFSSIACYLIVLGLSFIGLSYLIIYIGAVSILFLFILMLINVRISELQSNTGNSIPLAAIIIIFFNYILSYNSLTYNINYDNYTNIFNIIWVYIKNNLIKTYNKIYLNDKDIFYITGKIWDGNLIENDHITSIGNIMYSSYSIWLIEVSLILLLAMVGAIIITIKQKSY